MEHRRFDQLTKVVATGASRRTALRLLGGSALAGALTRFGLSSAAGQFGTEDDRDANCRGTCDKCDGDGQCCSGRCHDGACRCKQRGTCSHDRACCSGRCRSDGLCQRGQIIICVDGGSLDKGTCGPDDNFCQGSQANCNGEPDCICSSTSQGLVCHDLRCAVCARCTDAQDCRRKGFGASARCVSHDQCCGGESSCLTPCGQDCRDGGESRATEVAYGR